jgi:neutral ceramidase
MAGRRLKSAIRTTLLDNGFSSDVHVVIAGLSNTYSGYVTTYEEYQVHQRLIINKFDESFI